MARYTFTLEADERDDLTRLIRNGRASAKRIVHGLILLQADRQEGKPIRSDTHIAGLLQVGESTVKRVRKRFVLEGLEAALNRRPQPQRRAPKLDGQQEAMLVKLACSDPPAGHKRWTLRLLRNTLVELHVVDSLSHETVRRRMKQNDLKPWLEKQWCIPAEANAEFVCAMEDVLEVYQRPEDPQQPLVCMDEASRQLLEEVRHPLPMRAGKPRRYDSEYVRKGTANVFMLFEPLAGKRHVQVTDRRTRQDWAELIRQLVDEIHPHAPRITLVMDNLNTHTPASLYEAFDPAEARRIFNRLEIHTTPKHGSWLNMAEIELSVLSRQCMDRRIPDQSVLKREVAQWEQKRNARPCRVDWRFTTADARIKLRHLYPKPIPIQGVISNVTEH